MTYAANEYVKSVLTRHIISKPPQSEDNQDSMINQITLIGNLGSDPEMRKIENQRAVTKLRIATNENYKDRSGEWQTVTTWHTVKIWGDMAERAASKLTKGMQVYIQGKMTYNEWTDKNDTKRVSPEVIGQIYRIMGKKESAESQATTPVPKPAATETAAADDDLPF